MRIESMVLGQVGTNCYLAINDKTKETIIVDPADRLDKISQKVEEMKLLPVAILLTHGHFDHNMATDGVSEKYHIPIYISEKEKQTLKDPELNLSPMIGESRVFNADHFVKDGQEIELAGMKAIVLATPGHTPGGACYYFPEEQAVFSGDTLFNGSVGRSDFKGGSASALIQSIQNKLMKLPGDVNVYPGHMGITTIETEKKSNPFL